MGAPPGNPSGGWRRYVAYSWRWTTRPFREGAARGGDGGRPPSAGFLGGRSGAVAIEFGLLFPVFVLLLFGAMEVAFLSYANAALEAGARMASRTALVGVAGSDGTVAGTTEAAVREAIAEYALGPLDLSDSGDLTLKATAYRAWSDVPEPFDDADGDGVRDSDEPYIDVNGNGVFDRGGPPAGRGPGGSNQIVVYEVSYVWRSPLPFITSLIVGADTGRLRLRAASVVQNEPWSSVAGG